MGTQNGPKLEPERILIHTLELKLWHSPIYLLHTYYYVSNKKSQIIKVINQHVCRYCSSELALNTEHTFASKCPVELRMNINMSVMSALSVQSTPWGSQLARRGSYAYTQVFNTIVG
jgi:hypothetical protein